MELMERSVPMRVADGLLNVVRSLTVAYLVVAMFRGDMFGVVITLIVLGVDTISRIKSKEQREANEQWMAEHRVRLRELDDALRQFDPEFVERLERERQQRVRARTWKDWVFLTMILVGTVVVAGLLF